MADKDLSKQLVDKSIEAFIMAIEVYNKPTLKYRVEGFSFFICNAWELMLKAHLINTKGESSIYFPDKENRTISLEKCIRNIFTNDSDPLRKNLEAIIDLRNTCTHFITQEYEEIYAPLFQACVFNFAKKMLDFHSIDITDSIPEHFIHLSITNKPYQLEEVEAKYGGIIASKLIETKKSVAGNINDIDNSAYAITIRHEYYLSKKVDSNTQKMHFVSSEQAASGNVTIIKEVKDVNTSYPYAAKGIIKAVSDFLNKNGISEKFNKNTFNDFVQMYDIKHNSKYCYTHRVYDNPTYSYSQLVVDFINNEYRKDPKCGEKIHLVIREKKQSMALIKK